MFLTNHSSAFLLHDVRVVKNVASLSSLLIHVQREILTLSSKDTIFRQTTPYLTRPFIAIK